MKTNVRNACVFCVALLSVGCAPTLVRVNEAVSIPRKMLFDVCEAMWRTMDHQRYVSITAVELRWNGPVLTGLRCTSYSHESTYRDETHFIISLRDTQCPEMDKVREYLAQAGVPGLTS